MRLAEPRLLGACGKIERLLLAQFPLGVARRDDFDAEMPLVELLFIRTAVSDLEPLRGMPLQVLQLNDHTSDVSVLRGMPLPELQMRSCPSITDLSVLAECETLKRLLLPPNVTGIDFLRQLPKLEHISFEWDRSAHRPRQTGRNSGPNTMLGRRSRRAIWRQPKS